MATGMKAGLNPAVRASLGGSGWQSRTSTHEQDVEAGRIWSRCGCPGESARLVSCVLAQPSGAVGAAVPAREQLFEATPDVELMQLQCLALRDSLEAAGVHVDLLTAEDGPANLVFMRDLFFMTPAGAVIGRPAAAQRAGEPRLAAAFLAALGVPIAATIVGGGTFEGADALWVNQNLVLVGVGNRTNAQGAAQVASVLKSFGVETAMVPVPQTSQHLLGVLNFVADTVAAYNDFSRSAPIEEFCRTHDIELLTTPHFQELKRFRAFNFVALAPFKILAPAGADKTYAALRRQGIQVAEVPFSEYLKCDGGVGCSVAPILRIPLP